MRNDPKPTETKWTDEQLDRAMGPKVTKPPVRR